MKYVTLKVKEEPFGKLLDGLISLGNNSIRSRSEMAALAIFCCYRMSTEKLSSGKTRFEYLNEVQGISNNENILKTIQEFRQLNSN